MTKPKFAFCESTRTATSPIPPPKEIDPIARQQLIATLMRQYQGQMNSAQMPVTTGYPLTTPNQAQLENIVKNHSLKQHLKNYQLSQAASSASFLPLVKNHLNASPSSDSLSVTSSNSMRRSSVSPISAMSSCSSSSSSSSSCRNYFKSTSSLNHVKIEDTSTVCNSENSNQHDETCASNSSSPKLENCLGSGEAIQGDDGQIVWRPW